MYMCVSPCAHHTDVLYICMCSEHAAPGRVPAPAKALPEHTHTRVSPPTHSLGAVLHVCLQTPWFPLPEKGICIWSDSTCAFLKVKAETPSKGCMYRTQNIILLLSPKHDIPFPLLLFLFDCKGCIFPCMITLHKDHNSPFCSKDKLCWEVL